MVRGRLPPRLGFRCAACRRYVLSSDSNIGYIAICGRSPLLLRSAGGAIVKECGQRQGGGVLARADRRHRNYRAWRRRCRRRANTVAIATTQHTAAHLARSSCNASPSECRAISVGNGGLRDRVLLIPIAPSSRVSPRSACLAVSGDRAVLCPHGAVKPHCRLEGWSWRQLGRRSELAVFEGASVYKCIDVDGLAWSLCACLAS